MWNRPAASVAPVFPADTTASASPSPTARHARTSELFGFARTASTGFSCIVDRLGRLDELEPLRVEALRPVEDRPTSVGRGLERARDDVFGPPIAAHGVDGDADGSVTAYGAGVRSGSTSRPRYVLQVGQTRCGRFGWWQTGHSLTRGAFRRCVALRLSRRVAVCLRFGTAMAGRAV